MESIAARALRNASAAQNSTERRTADEQAAVQDSEEETGAEPFTRETDPLASAYSEETVESAEAEPAIDEAPYSDDYSEAPAADEVPFDNDYAEGYAGEEESASSFEYRAPFTARRNPLRMWTAAAAIFALLATGTIVAVNFYGLPAWLPISQPTFGIGKSELVLDFPQADQREETLDNGEEIFRVRGSITNVGTETQSVPRLLVVFYDERERAVFNKVVVPAKDELAPGESLNVTEAISDIPENADEAAIGWSPG